VFLCTCVGDWFCLLVLVIGCKVCFFTAVTDFVRSVWQFRPLSRAKLSKTARSQIKIKIKTSKELR
jgi:hypothetical protein